MPGLSSRRALRVAAVALPAAATATLLSLPADATTAPDATPDPTPRTTTATTAAATVTITPKFSSLPLRTAPGAAAGAGTAARAAAAAAPARLQTFTRSFRYGRSNVRYTMVGHSTAVARTAAISNTITPIAFRFGTTVKAPSRAVLGAVRGSGLYKPQAFPGGRGQYGDVFMRTQFWKDLRNGARAWHVLLRTPTVTPALKLTVPVNKGGVARVASGPVHLVDVAWFDSKVQGAVAAGSPAALTQFLAADVVLCGRYDPADLSSCGIGGYHSAIRGKDGGVRTYSYQSWLSPRLFGVKSGFYGLAPMSHELAEWLANPYLTNEVPEWTEASNPQYGCSDELEVGDPLVGKVLRVNKQVYQDEAYLSYFAREKPSRAWAGRYTWFNSFKTYSSRC